MSLIIFNIEVGFHLCCHLVKYEYNNRLICWSQDSCVLSVFCLKFKVWDSRSSSPIRQLGVLDWLNHTPSIQTRLSFAEQKKFK